MLGAYESKRSIVRRLRAQCVSWNGICALRCASFRRPAHVMSVRSPDQWVDRASAQKQSHTVSAGKACENLVDCQLHASCVLACVHIPRGRIIECFSSMLTVVGHELHNA